MAEIFDHYAAYYDLLNADKDYTAEAAFVARLIREIAPAARTILELGCGTGLHAVELSSMGLKSRG